MITSEGLRFSEKAKVKAILAYGIDILDSNIEFYLDEDELMTHLYEIEENNDFIEFASIRGIAIKEWKEEDCRQLWIVVESSYVETVDFERPDIYAIDTNIWDDVIIEVKNEMFRLLKKKGIKSSYDEKPRWGLHLFYS